MDSYLYDTGAAALIFGFAMFAFFFAIIGYVLSSLFLMKIFEKAGVEGKWRAWVPVYNGMIFLKLGDMSPWLVLYAVGASLLLSWIPVIGQIVPIAAAVLMVLAAYRVGQKLQKEGAWVVLYIFLSIVWLGINAYDKSRWNTQIPPAPWAGNAFFGDRTVWDGVPAQSSGQVAPGYGAAPQGYGATPGYQSPAAPGYQQPPAAPGYQPPAAPGNPPPAAPGYQPPSAAPATPPAAPAGPAVPPVTPPPAAPPAPPAPPADPTQPPA